MSTHYIRYARSCRLVRMSMVSFVSLVSLFLGSCSDFNLFTIVPPPLGRLISGRIDKFIYSLDRHDVIKAFRNSEKNRTEAIKTLQERIKNTSGHAKTKNQIGLAAVLIKTTGLSDVYTPSLLSTLLNTSEESIGDIVSAMFIGIKDNAKKISRIINHSMTLRDTLSGLGDSIKQNGVPFGHEGVEAKYAGGAALSGTIALMVDTIVVVDKPGKEVTEATTDQKRKTAAVEYLSGTNTKHRFKLEPEGASVGEVIFKDKNEGLEYLLRSGGFWDILDRLEEK